jgi:glycosyltransferase 2 family protein
MPGSGRRLLATRVVITGLGFVVSGVFLVVAVHRLDSRAILQVLGGAHLVPWVPAAIASYLLGHVVRGMRCTRLLAGQAHLPLATGANVVVVGYAVNNLLPARAGELARSAMVSERTGIPFAHSLTIIFIERILDGLAILVVFLVAAWLTAFSVPWLKVPLWASLVVFVSAALVVAVAAALPGVPVTITSRLTARLPPRWQRRAVSLAGSFSAGVSAIGSVRRAGRLFALSLLVWCFEAGMFLLLLPALDLPLQAPWAMLAMAVTNLGLMVPSSPGFIGSFHLFCMKTVAALGVDPTTAFAYAVLVHAAFYVPVTLWGVAALFRYGVELAALKGVTGVVQNLPQPEGPLSLVASLPPPAPRKPPGSRLLRAIVEAVLPEPPPAVADDVAVFVAGQVQALPRRLRLAFAAGLVTFDLASRLRHPRGFAAQPRATRVALVESWAFGDWPQGRKLFRLVRSIALLAYYEHPLVASQLSPPEVARLHGPGGRDR